MTRRVAITGMGVVGSFGLTTESLWSTVTAADQRPVVPHLAEFDPSPWFTTKEARRTAAFIHYSVAAAANAHADAGSPDLDPERTGLMLGNILGPMAQVAQQTKIYEELGSAEVSASLCAIVAPSTAAAAVARHQRCKGPVQVVTATCASSLYALGDAGRLVADGTVDAAYAGGIEGPMTEALLASFANIRVRSDSGVVRPFDRRRDGTEFSDGGAVFLLEEWGAAVARGATILGELAGWGNTNDAASMVAPDPDGAVRCIRVALDRAGLGPGDIAHVNAHGTGTLANDLTETAALRTVFGASVPPVTAVKRAVGHMSAGAGAIELAAAVLSIRHRLLPPVGVGFEPDPDIDLDLVVEEPRPWDPGPVLKTSFGFGGHNGAVILKPVTP